MSDSSTTQAMTEVALGLSMAFFSLMILAMLSMGLESVTSSTDVTQVEQVKIENSQHTMVDNRPNNSAYLVFYQERFFDEHLQPKNIRDLSAEQHYVVAVSPDIALTQLLQIRRQLKKLPKLTITQLSPKWLKRLEEN